MVEEIKAPENYFKNGCGRCNRYGTFDCSAHKWSSGLKMLRSICLDAELTETLKWSHPCYMHYGRNVVILGAFIADFRLNFFQAGLLEDPFKILRKRSENSQVADCLKFDHVDQVIEQKTEIEELLKNAIALAASGRRIEKREIVLERPEILVEILSEDAVLKKAFDVLTPGRQRSYILHLNNAKNDSTKRRRLMSARQKILSGKGALER
jgi:uncharacterized protein YdeI (YjbR/CyaY-like superfamily)